MATFTKKNFNRTLDYNNSNNYLCQNSNSIGEKNCIQLIFNDISPKTLERMEEWKITL